MKEVLVIYDADILIDFCKLALVEEMFRLPFEFHAVDVVWNELKREQQSVYLPHIAAGKLVVAQIDEVEMLAVYTVRRQCPQLSFSDCSALIYAKHRGGVLLTSDKNLRSTAIQNAVQVRGHLWVFDELYHESIINGETLIKKLEDLCCKVNPSLGLPSGECGKRRNEWRGCDE